MKNRVILAIAMGIGLIMAASAGAENEPFQRTEERERCRNYDPLRQPAYGRSRLRSPGELSLRGLSDFRSPLVRSSRCRFTRTENR
jgi:hypothetical protein